VALSHPIGHRLSFEGFAVAESETRTMFCSMVAIKAWCSPMQRRMLNSDIDSVFCSGSNQCHCNARSNHGSQIRYLNSVPGRHGFVHSVSEKHRATSERLCTNHQRPCALSCSHEFFAFLDHRFRFAAASDLYAARDQRIMTKNRTLEKSTSHTKIK
jgi:hypothetical protein